MARGGINLAVVKIAREALLARGVHPSIDAVRVELGNTGSKSTIQRYLKVLAAREPTEAAPTVDEELQHFVAGLGARLTALAGEAVAEDRLRLQRERATHEQRRLQQQNQLDQLQAAHATLTHDLQALRSHERSLQEQLRAAAWRRANTTCSNCWASVPPISTPLRTSTARLARPWSTSASNT